MFLSKQKKKKQKQSLLGIGPAATWKELVSTFEKSGNIFPSFLQISHNFKDWRFKSIKHDYSLRLKICTPFRHMSGGGGGGVQLICVLNDLPKLFEAWFYLLLVIQQVFYKHTDSSLSNKMLMTAKNIKASALGHKMWWFNSCFLQSYMSVIFLFT